MSVLTYWPPSGGIIENPNEELLGRDLLNLAPTFWGNGALDAGLHYDGEEGQTHLVFNFKEGMGFLVLFESDPNSPPLVLTERPDANDVVELLSGGNTIRVPESHIVSPAAALEAALAFMKSGRPMAIGDWIEFSPEEP